MTKSMKSLMMGAALAGFMAGHTVVAQNTSSAASVSSSHGQRRQQHQQQFFQEKHACKGQNSCKGQGGCKSGDNGCKGKNSAKAKAAVLPTAPSHTSRQVRPNKGRSDRAVALPFPSGLKGSHSSFAKTKGLTLRNMPANRFNGFTEYGVGIGLRIPHYNHILRKSRSLTGSKSSPRIS